MNRISGSGLNSRRQKKSFEMSSYQKRTDIVFGTQTTYIMMRNTWMIFLTALLVCTSAMAQVRWKDVHALIYTRNGKGYVHENRAASVEMMKNLSKEHGFKLDVSDDPAIFTDENLSKYDLLIFSNTNNDVFDTDAQRTAFRRYIESGGGFVGLHSVMGTERNWTWFKQMLGGTFSWHAVNQTFKVRNLRPDHPSMQGVPALWERKDECYFSKELFPGIEVLMVHELASLDRKQEAEILKNAGHYKDFYPTAWYHAYDGGHVWVTTLGHDIFNYSEPVYMNHVLQGLRYIAGKTAKRNLGKSYAADRDTPLSIFQSK
jgi:type 1 glutamine amidotransferase